MAGETQMAALLREIRQSIADQIAPVAADAKEARDGVLQMAAKMEGQNVEARLEKLSADVKALGAELRSDIVNQHARLKQEMTDCFEDVDKRITDQNARLVAVERFVSQADGRNTVFGWMLRHLPGPVIAAVGTFLAMIGLDKRL